MISEIRLFLAATILSAAAGSLATLAVLKATGATDSRDQGTLPEFEDRFVRDFGLPEGDRKFVRAILHKYQDRRREIEGRAAEAAEKELTDLGRTIDAELCAILPPDRQKRYYALLDRAPAFAAIESRPGDNASGEKNH
ncbi:MAG: hypothetical protein HY286_11810 [Planctomycetes bacterium]|nr:hypothetical protein [Planctomycetota bacterium]